MNPSDVKKVYFVKKLLWQLISDMCYYQQLLWSATVAYPPVALWIACLRFIHLRATAYLLNVLNVIIPLIIESNLWHIPDLNLSLRVCTLSLLHYLLTCVLSNSITVRFLINRFTSFLNLKLRQHFPFDITT